MNEFVEESLRRVGRDRHNWNAAARYTVHSADGSLVCKASPNRSIACQNALMFGLGHWVKDNINTYFFYGVDLTGLRRIRIGSVAHGAFDRRYPASISPTSN